MRVLGTSSAWRCAASTTASRSTSAATAIANGRRSGDYSLPTQVRDIEGFIEKLGLKRPLFVGHSMGGFAGDGLRGEVLARDGGFGAG
jgi:pimeloyl-ACP methyl ester carboxylesterase